MKLLILTILLFTSSVFSAQPKNFKAFGVTGSKTYIRNKAKCESKESGKAGYLGCFNVAKKSKPFHVIGLVDDSASPKYLKQGPEVCADFASCQAIHESKDCSTFTDAFSVIASDFSEVYCAEPNGFNKKPGIVIDAALKSTFDADKAAKVVDKSKRKTKRTSRKNALKTCAKTKIADFTAAIQKNCIRSIARELMRLELLESEL